MGRKLVQNQKTDLQLDKRYLIPSILTVGFVPLIVRVHIYNTHLAKYEWYPAVDGAADVFLQYKQWAVVILACACLLLLLVRSKYYFEEMPLCRFMIPAGIYGIMVLLSAIFGKDPLFAFAGSYDMFESALAILSFLVICYYTYVSIVSLDYLLYFLRGAEYFVLVELLITFFQVLGKDIFATGFGKRLILPLVYWDQLDAVQTVTQPGNAYGTIFNADYFSMYIGVLIPIFVFLIFCENSWRRRIFNFVLCILGVIVIFHGALSGVVGIAGAFVIGFLIIFSGRKKPFLITVGILVVCLISGGITIHASMPIREKVSSIIGNDGSHIDDEIPLKEVRTGNEYATISFVDGRELHLSYSINDETGKVDFLLTAEDGNSLTLQLRDENFQIYDIMDPAWQDCYVGRAGNPAGGMEYYVYLSVDERTLGFKRVSHGRYLYVNNANRLIELPETPQPQMANVFSDGFFSGRGYLYNHCVPLLKNYFFLGAGANNFILAYPQTDYVRRVFNGQNSTIYNVKPHSAFLQQWIEEGFIGLVAILVFFFWYIIDSVSLYRKAFWLHISVSEPTGESEIEQKRLVHIGIGLFLGILSYLIVMLANDSTICTAPVFWTLLGAGWAVNGLVKKQMPEYKPAAKQTTKKK